MTLIGFKGKSVFPIFLRLPLHLATVYSVIPGAYFIFSFTYVIYIRYI